MNWSRNRPRSEAILAIMLAVAIIGSGIWKLVIYIQSVIG